MLLFMFAMWHFINSRRLAHWVTAIALVSPLTACGVSTIAPEGPKDAEETAVKDVAGTEANETGTNKTAGDDAEEGSQGEVNATSNAPEVPEGSTLVGWRTDDGQLLQPDGADAASTEATKLTAVHHPNEAIEITLENVRAGTPTANHGFPLDIDGLTLAIGAPHTDVAGVPSGSVDVLSWDGSSWRSEARLTVQDANDTPGADTFGASVDVADERLAVGAPLANNQQGATYLFEKRRGSWSHTQTLVSPNPTHLALFGADIAMAGNRLFVTESPLEADAKVHLYELDAEGTWRWATSFGHNHAPQGSRIDRVVADGNTVAFIGEPRSATTPPNGVSINTWDGSVWNADTVDIPGGARPWSLGLDGDRLVVGVLESNCAYAYQREARGQWVAASPALMACGSEAEHPRAGFAVAVAGAHVAVGDNAANASRGEVLGFRDTGAGWSSVQVAGGGDGGRAGTTLAMNEHLLVTGRGVLGGPEDTVVATVQPTAALFD